MSVKEFEYAATAQATPKEEADREFKLPGEDYVYTAHLPGSGQLAMVMARMGRHTTMHTKIAGVIDFFVGCLEPEDASHVSERLLDGNDPLNIEDVTPAMQWLLAEWSGRPTG